MPCPLSAKMTITRCRELKRSNPSCRGCEETLTRRIMIDIELDVYDAIHKDAEGREITVEASILELLTDAASGEFVMMRR